MALIKGGSQSSTQAADLLADIETALTTAGWSDLGEYTDGTYNYHGWRSSAVNSGHLDWVVVLRVQTSGAGDLSMFSGENWRSSDGKIQKPTVGRGHNTSPGVSITFESISETQHTVSRVWLERDGGDNTIGPPYGSYLSAATPLTEAWWWNLYPGDSIGNEYKPVFRGDIDVQDSTFVQWVISAHGDSLFVSTYRWNALSHDWTMAWCNEVFLPWPADPLIAAASKGSAQIAGHRAYLHPEYVTNHISPDYGTDIGTTTSFGSEPEVATRALSVFSMFEYEKHQLSSLSNPSEVGSIGSSNLGNRYGTAISGGGPLLAPLGIAIDQSACIVIHEGQPHLPYVPGYGGSRHFVKNAIYASSIPNIYEALQENSRVNIGDEIEAYDTSRYVSTGIPGSTTISNQSLWVPK